MALNFITESFEDLAIARHAQVCEAQCIEPIAPSLLAFHDRDRRGTPCDEACRRMHGHGLEAVRRMSGSRVEDVRVADAVDVDEALVVAARRDAAPIELERGDQLAGHARMAD